MAEITEKSLVVLGYERRDLNGGIIREYFKYIQSDKVKLAVRFNERKDQDFMVWLIFTNFMYQLTGIRERENLELLFGLLKQ